MKRFYSTLGIDQAIKEQEEDNIETNNKINYMKNKNCKKEFGSCQCPDCIIPVRNDSSKTWQERFEEEFWGKFGSTKTINEIKQFISQVIDQTREETIKEILSQLRLKLRNTYKAEDIADTAFLTESDLESVLNLL